MLLVTIVTGAQAADWTAALTNFTKVGNTYTYEFSTVKLKNYTKIYVEIPSATVTGTVSWKGEGANSDRHVYIYKTNGTVKDETRGIEYKKEYVGVTYTSSDIATVDGKYYLVFATTDDFKAVGVKYTVPAAIEKYTVTFDAGEDGSCATTSLEEESAGAGVTLPAVTDVTSGKAFMGWANGDGDIVGTAGETYYPTANIPLYAQYQAIAPYSTPIITEINGTVKITSTENVAGKTIKYSLDGGSTYSNYTIPFNLSEAKTVKAYVTGSSAAYTDSEVAEAACGAIPAATAGSSSLTLYYNDTDMTKGSSKPYPLTGKTGTDYEGWAITIDNTSKELGSGNNINGKKSLKGSNGVQVQITMPDGVKANRVTIYSYNNADITNTSLWSEVAGTTYTDETEIGLESRSAGTPDVRVFALDDVTGTITLNNNGQAQQCFIAVVDYTKPAIAVTGVTVDATAEIAVGGSTTLTATVLPAGATNKNVTWTSDAPEIATVADGVVTGVGEGTANITVTTEDGGFTATCEVTVIPVAGTDIIKATMTSKNTATVTGTIGGTATVNLQNDSYKFGAAGNYVSLTLASGTFQAGDVINVHTSTAADTNPGTLVIFGNSADDIVYNTGGKGGLGNNKFVLPAAVNGKSTISVRRTADFNFNGYVDYISVTRASTTVTIGAGGYSTYAADNNFTVNGAIIYKAKKNGEKVSLVEVAANTVIKAGEGIILNGEEGATVSITNTEDAAEDLSDNELVGVTANQPFSKGTNSAFVIATKSSKTGFYEYTGSSFPAGKAYLSVEGVSGDFLAIDFTGEATAIENVNANDNANSAAPVKVIKNGKLYIGNFNVAGQQVK